MSKFKLGDYVVPVRVMRTDDAVVQELGNQVGKVLQVITVFQSINLSVFAGKPNGEAWCWHPAELRLATAEEIAAAQKLKPLRRGDLVMWNGEIHMVFDDHPDSHGEYRAVKLTGECGYDYTPAKELTRIGSIRKKVKRLQAQMEGAK